MRSTQSRTYDNRCASFSRLLPIMLIVAMLLAWTGAPAFTADDEFKEEKDIGKEAAAQVAKEVKFVEDAKLLERVNKIGAKIAKVATEKEFPATYGKSTVAQFDYKFHIVDDEDINAFALPAGYIYVNKGLLDYVHSDDELAGVIAHETVHSAHHHAMQLMKEQQKNMLIGAAAVIATAAAGAENEDVANIMYVASLVNIAKLSDYGQKAEIDADRTAVAYMHEAGFNPVGMWSFMDKLAREEAGKPRIEWGIFATHPPAHKRRQWIAEELKKRGVEINNRTIRQVTNYTDVEVKPVEGKPASAIWVGSTEIVRLADLPKTEAGDRAKQIADDLSRVLLAGAGIHDVRTEGGKSLVIMGKTVFTPTEEDAKLADSTIPELTKSTADAVRRALMKERLGTS